jgi:hypothetical protein
MGQFAKAMKSIRLSCHTNDALASSYLSLTKLKMDLVLLSVRARGLDQAV